MSRKLSARIIRAVKQSARELQEFIDATMAPSARKQLRLTSRISIGIHLTRSLVRRETRLNLIPRRVARSDTRTRLSSTVAVAVDRRSGPTMAASLDTPSTPGLSETAAAAGLQRDGYNELPSAKPRSVLAIALEVVREPMFILLIASGAIYLLLGDPAEAVALLAAVFSGHRDYAVSGTKDRASLRPCESSRSRGRW